MAALDSLLNKQTNLENSANSSNTMYGSIGTPIKSDISRDRQLASVNKQIDDLKSKQLRNQWYGPTTAPVEDTGSSDGLVMGALKTIQKPLNAIVGAGQYALGKGTERDVFSNMDASMKEGRTWGNVLSQYNMPRSVQVPLGFTLDMMTDPLILATAGTSALIPRVGMGLIKGGRAGAGVKGALEATGVGITSNLQKKAVTAMNLMPFSRRIAQGAKDMAEENAAKLAADPSFVTTPINGYSKAMVKYRDLVDRVGAKAVAGSEKYDSMIGKTLEDRLNKGILDDVLGTGLKASTSIGGKLEEALRKIPSKQILGKNTWTGDQVVDFMKYTTMLPNEMADLKDAVFRAGRNKNAIITPGEKGLQFTSMKEFEHPNAMITVKDKVEEGVQGALKEADGTSYLPRQVRIRDDNGNLVAGYKNAQFTVQDNIDNAKYLLGAAIDDSNMKKLLNLTYKKMEKGKTGVDFLDNGVQKLKDFTLGDVANKISRVAGQGDMLTKVNTSEKVGDDFVQAWNKYNAVADIKPLEKLLEIFPSYTAIFKFAKVPLNAGSHVVAQLGNFFMGAMMGLPVQKVEYLNSVREAKAILTGKSGAAGIKEMFFNDVNSLADMLENNPNRFKMVTGMNPYEIYSKIKAANISDAVSGVMPTSKGALAKYLKDMWEKVESAEEMSTKLAAAEKAGALTPGQKMNLKAGFKSATEVSKDAKIGGVITRGDESSGVSSEIGTDFTDKIKDAVAKNLKDNPNSATAQLANWFLNSMPKAYETIDQSWKLGTLKYLTKVGLNEEELITISRTIPIDKAKDLLPAIQSNGEKLYRLTPLKAAEVAMEAFMNYSGMPDFVRMMRAVPFGSPFASFPYAMLSKVSKTAIHNPAIFNKVTYALNEMNASRTPQERAALENKYNQYLKSPTVVKIAGMWNTDIKNFVPYYTMNMFNPSQRNYGTSFGGQMLQLSDKFPVFQDPIGQVFKDYIIQPWVLSGSGQIPQGQFGQPLYPNYDVNGKLIKPTIGTKAFYGTRTLAESVVPGAASLLGPALVGLSPETINMVPSYGMRSTAFASQGRSSIGAMTKEDAVRKGLAAWIGKLGVPAYQLDPTKTATP